MSDPDLRYVRSTERFGLVVLLLGGLLRPLEAKLGGGFDAHDLPVVDLDEHRAELEAMHSPEGRQSLQSVIDSYERMIALIQRRAEKP